MTAIILLILPTASLVAQEEAATLKVPTNLELIQRLSQQVGDSVAIFLTSSDSVRVTVHPAEAAWYIEGIVRQTFISKGRVPTQSLSSRYAVDLGLVRARVVYANVRRTGLFAAKVVDRTVTVEFVTKVVENSSGVILLSRNIAQLSNDTVELSDIESLENQSIPATRGSLPKEGFFSTMLEPLVAIGTIAVAVYLLFHVRS